MEYKKYQHVCRIGTSDVGGGYSMVKYMYSVKLMEQTEHYI